MRKLPVPTPAEARRIWESTPNPSSRGVARKLSQSGARVSHMTVSRWRRRGWRPVTKPEHPLDKARAALQDNQVFEVSLSPAGMRVEPARSGQGRSERIGDMKFLKWRWRIYGAWRVLRGEAAAVEWDGSPRPSPSQPGSPCHAARATRHRSERAITVICSFRPQFLLPSLDQLALVPLAFAPWAGQLVDLCVVVTVRAAKARLPDRVVVDMHLAVLVPEPLHLARCARRDVEHEAAGLALGNAGRAAHHDPP